MLDETLAETQAEWGAANAEYNANIRQLEQEVEALQQKAASLDAARRCAQQHVLC